MKLRRNTFALHPGQMAIWQDLDVPKPPREVVIAAGARWGKDRFCLLAMLSLALRMYNQERERRAKAKLIPLVLCWYVAPTYGLLRQAWDELKAITGAWDFVKLNESEKRCYLKGGAIQIEFKSADRPNLLLARGLDIVVITEAARIKEDALTLAIMQRLASPLRGFNGEGGLLIMNSTPNGKNWYYKRYLDAVAGKAGAKAYHFTTFDNPLINKAEILRQKEILPEYAYRQEFLAEFVSREGAVFKEIETSLKSYCFPQLESDGDDFARYFIGIDWGRENDRTAISVVRHCGKTCQLVNFVLLDRMAFDQQIETILRIAADYPTAEIISEKNGIGLSLTETLKEQAENKVTAFDTTAKSKPELINKMIVLFEQKRILLPASPGAEYAPAQEIEQLFEELRCYECKRNANDYYTYNAPAGMHDDCVISLCLACAGKEVKSGNGLQAVR